MSDKQKSDEVFVEDLIQKTLADIRSKGGVVITFGEVEWKLIEIGIRAGIKVMLEEVNTWTKRN